MNHESGNLVKKSGGNRENYQQNRGRSELSHCICT